MEKAKNLVLPGIVAAVVALVIGFNMGGKTTETIVDKTSPPQYGAVSSPVSPYNYNCVGGLCTYQQQFSVAATSSVLCSMLNPTNAGTSNGISTSTGATSTLEYFSARLNGPATVANGGFGAQVASLSTSTTAFASSSPMFLIDVPLNVGQNDISWAGGGATTTLVQYAGRLLSGDLLVTGGNSSGANVYRVGPNEFVNFRIATATPGTFATNITGTCSYIFRVY